MKNFNCQAMPEEVRDLFFDTYRLPNNSIVTSVVNEERKPILDWLINNGADIDEEVQIAYNWKEEKTKLFSYKDYKSDDEE